MVKSKKPLKKLSKIPPKMKKEMEEYLKHQKNPRDLRVMIWSQAPFIRSSEGILAHFLSQGFLAFGIPNVLCAYYGIQPGGYITFNKLAVLPVERTITDPLGYITTATHFAKFKLHIILYLHDFWLGSDLCDKVSDTYVYAKLDSLNYPKTILKILKKYKGVIAPTKFAKKELDKYGIDSTYIPLGVNLRSYQPYPKLQSRKNFGIPPKVFCIGIVGTNKDKGSRKGWNEMFQTIADFFLINPKAKENTKILIHTDPSDKDGLPLKSLARQYGIAKNVIWQDPHLIMLGVPELFMARLYNAMDVLLNLSSREGTNAVVQEAGACGIPSIVTDFSAMRERVNNGKAGWLVKPTGLKPTQLGAQTAIPNPKKAAEALTEAYKNVKKRKKLGKKALAYAKQFNWEIVMAKYWVPYLEKLGIEYILKPKAKAKVLIERIRKKKKAKK